MLNIDCIEHLIPESATTIYIGYSGGMDSHVLLHLLSKSHFKPRLCAVYIHHGLQRQADDWACHCRQQAHSLGVDFRAMHVDATPSQRQSPEEAARDARYVAFQGLLNKGDVLMLAQHREDQLETVLLQLFRGAGLQGLAGMPESMPLGQGNALRPFLNRPVQQLRTYAVAHQLHWIEDPSNQCTDFDRNFLRQDIIPLLKQRWPGLDKTVSRSARHCAVAAELLQAETAKQFHSLYDETQDRLDIEQLSQLPEQQQMLIIRYWFKRNGLNYPSQKQLHKILTDIIGARADANPQMTIQKHHLRRYRQGLYLLEDKPINRQKTWAWPASQSDLVLENSARLKRVIADCGIPVSTWEAAKITVAYRQGSEKIALPNRKGRHTLKKLFQEYAIPPWLRDNMPLIYLDGQLAAVGDLWISADLFSQLAQGCYQIVYEQ